VAHLARPTRNEKSAAALITSSARALGAGGRARRRGGARAARRARTFAAPKTKKMHVLRSIGWLVKTGKTTLPGTQR
jgi:hypothetical protein